VADTTPQQAAHEYASAIALSHRLQFEETSTMVDGRLSENVFGDIENQIANQLKQTFEDEYLGLLQ
jgi:broad specificity phosphatase PhoE